MTKPLPERGLSAIGEKNSTAVAVFESVAWLIDYFDLRNRIKALFCAASRPISGADFKALSSI
jgi:hypothetical protein